MAITVPTAVQAISDQRSLEKPLPVVAGSKQAVSASTRWATGKTSATCWIQLGASLILRVVMTLLSRKVRKQAKALDVHYEFFFMRASGSQLRELGARYDAGALRPVIDRTFPFEQTSEAMAYVEQGRTKAGKVVVIMPSAPDVGSSAD